MSMGLSVERLKHWGLRGGLGILDQGLYSGANFLLNILLARWISPAVYGGFSAGYSLFLLFSIAQVALIAEPMSIFGADKYRRNVTSFLNYLLRIQWIGALFGVLFFLLISLFIVDHVLRDSVIAMAVALPFILFYWYLRRAFYIEMQPGVAMVTSFVYSILLISFIFLMRLVDQMTPLVTYLAMALSSLVASFFALRRLGIRFLGRGAVRAELDPKTVNGELWRFGKWILPAYLAGWFTNLSFPFFITILLDAQSAGAFRALQNLFLPLQQLLSAITLLVLPWLAKQKSDYGSAKLFAATQVAAGIAGVSAVIYCFCIAFFRYEIVDFLYSNVFYSSFDSLVIILAFSAVLGSGPLVLGLALRVLGRPNIILFSKVSAAIFTLLFGVPMIWIFRMSGAAFSIIGSAVVEVSILLFFYVRIKHYSKAALPSAK